MAAETRPKKKLASKSKRPAKKASEAVEAQATVARPPVRRGLSAKSKKVGALIERLNKAMINKKDGSKIGRLYRASEIQPAFTLRRPTGLLSLDTAIAGGLPAGAISEIVSQEGVGKTTLANFVMAENQRIYGEESAIFIASVEGGYDKEHARECGVRMAYSQQEIAELEEKTGRTLAPDIKKAMMEDQVGEVVEARGQSAEVLLDEVIEMVRSNLFQVGVFDSIGAMMPAVVDEKSVGDVNVAAAARLLTKFCQKWFGTQSLEAEGRFNQTSLIIINQFRVGIGMSSKPGVIVKNNPGGHAIRHAKALEIELRSNPFSMKDKVVDKDTGEVLGKVVTWTIRKQKQGGHEGAKGNYIYVYSAHQVDKAQDAFTAGVNASVIKRNGAAYYIWEGKQYHGEPAIVKVLRDSENRDKLRAQTMEALGIKFLVGK